MFVLKLYLLIQHEKNRIIYTVISVGYRLYESAQFLGKPKILS